MAEMDVLGSLLNMIPRRRQQDSGNDMSESMQEMALRDRQRLDDLRGITVDYVELMNKADTRTEKLYHRNILEGVLKNASPQWQKALAPILANSPLDPVMIAQEKFVQRHGPAPQQNTEFKGNELGYAQTEFARWDYQARWTHAKGGKVPEKKSWIGLPDGYAGYRSKDGLVSVFTPEEFAMTSEGQKYGMPLGKAIAQQGMQFGPDQEFIQNGVKMKARRETDIMTGDSKIVVRPVGHDQDPRFNQGVLKDISELKGAFALQDKETSQDYKLFDKLVLEEGMKPNVFAARYLAGRFPGYAVRINGLEKVSSWNIFNWDEYAVEAGKYGLFVIPGKDVYGVANFERHRYILAPDNKTILDAYGQPIPSTHSMYPTKLETN